MRLVTLLLVACLSASPIPAFQDGIKSKDPRERIAAIERVEPGDRGAKTLRGMFGDPDWEVIERAVARLATVGSASDADAAAQLAIDGPVRRIRLEAARTATALDADKAAKAFIAKARGKTAVEALEALAIAGPHSKDDAAARPLEKLCEDKDARTRAAAAAAWVAASASSRPSVVEKLLASSSVVVQAGAADGAVLAADPATAPVLVARLAKATSLDPVVERRIARALAADANVAAHVRTLVSSADAVVAGRGARLARATASREGADHAALFAALTPGRSHADVGVRAQVAAVLGLLPIASATETAREIALGDADARVRRAATRAACERMAEDGAALVAFAEKRLEREGDTIAREEILVELGRRGLDAAVPLLVRSLTSDDWRIVVAAAVSLGKTRSAEARAPLEALRDRSKSDWRARTSAITGLALLYRTDAVPAVIDALADDEPMIRRVAHGWLVAATDQTFPPEPGPWKTWWTERGSRTELIDLAERDERVRRFGYAGVSPQEVYRGLDVLVLQSRGDSVESTLKHTDVPHRMTTASRIRADGPDPRGLFIANCTGEITPPDIEVLSFFLRAGGYVFGSCWALEETIGRIAPGNTRRLPTRDEVLDNVHASAAAPGSPYLEGVFAGASIPVYALEGAFLIDVLMPERVEVLVDSAEAAERWGGGDLAAWFRVGHGLVLDSVNHFASQGLSRALGLRKPEERQAYAVDHMAYDYESLRKTRDEKFWSGTNQASQAVPDLSVFRLVTNIVRLRRLSGE